MSITIHLPPATLDQLKAYSEATGKDVDTVVQEAVEEKLTGRKRSLMEILKPIHDEVERSGISDEDLDLLIEKEIASHRAEKHSNIPQ